MKTSKKYLDLGTDYIKVPTFAESNGFYATKKSSNIMSKIKSKDTKAEIKLRKALWNLGYRYRLNKKMLKGKPDLVFNSKKIVIFIDGDFWHGHNWQERKLKLKTNTKYWIPKIERNMQRDKEVTSFLKNEGWEVLRFWEHEIKNDLANCLKKIRLKLDKK